MIDQDKQSSYRNWLILGVIWLLGAIADRLWFSLDRSVPAWDQADYLTGALNYWHLLQQPQWLSGEWWINFWTRSPKIPPFTYITTVPFLNLFGTSSDSATLVQLFYSAILLSSIYGLGVLLFNPVVGLWAAGICQLLPGLYRYRLDFLLDYPLTAVVTLSFFCLTLWTKKHQVKAKLDWLYAIIFGVSFGIALLVKQTSLFFLFVPIIWLGCEAIYRKNWKKLAQLITSLSLAALIIFPWYRLNWLLILTSGKRATVDSAIAEGDPALNTLDAWLYYWKITPYLVSWPLLLVPIVGLIFYGWKYLKTAKPDLNLQFSIKWLALFLIGAYLLCSLNINKDARYVLPYLPVVSLILAWGLLAWDRVTRRWGFIIRWTTIGLATLLMLLNLYPLGGASLTQILSPRVQHHAYLGQLYPHQQVIDEIIQTEPYLRSNLGVLPSTPTVNQHNFNYYGALKNFQVYGRQVGTQMHQVLQDARSLSWFLTKTGNQGSVPQPAQANITQIVETGGDFQLQKSWPLIDGSTLKLYHQQFPSLQVQPISQPRSQVQLEAVIVPAATPPGVPVPVTYRWSGPWQQLQSGLVLLTWKNVKPGENSRWLHDRAIALGNLHSGEQPIGANASFQVTELLAMFPPADVQPGTYTLEATYLNRNTGESYPITVPSVRLNIDPTAQATPARELDLGTQLRILATDLDRGIQGLEPVFEQVGRINQYDPVQDYLIQTEKTLSYRLQREPKNLDWAYALALSQVLQQKVDGAIASLQQTIALDDRNPFPRAYLAFVYLYDWRPKAAETVLEQAIALNAEIPEIHALNGVAALMQGNLVKAWRELKNFNLRTSAETPS